MPTADQPRPARATIKDVAGRAGVSIKTVSRVLNRERYVGAEARSRVEAAVAALGFRPNAAARSLAGRRSFQIALVCDNPSPYYVYEMQSGVRDRCEADGVRMIAQPYDRESGGLLAEVAGLIATTPLDGLILTPPACDDAALLALLAERGLRIVRVSPGGAGAGAAVFIDNRAGAAAMVAHLAALGHARIAFVTGHPSYAASAVRWQGYRDGLANAGLAYDAALVREGRYDFASGASAAAGLLALAEPPSAIFAANDASAAGVLAEAHRRGVGVPGALSVAGFGDDALAAYVWPPLTTVRQPTRRLGYEAADLLLTEAEERRELAFELIVRESTARAI